MVVELIFIILFFKQLKDIGVCDNSCQLLHKIRITNGNWTKALVEINQFLKNYDIGKGVNNYSNIASNNNGEISVTPYRWDKLAMGTGIELSKNCMNVFLKESAYMFRSILGDQVKFIFRQKFYFFFY